MLWSACSFHQPAQFVTSALRSNVNYVISKQWFAVLLIVDYKIYTAVLIQFVCSHVYEFVIIVRYS